MTFLTMFVLEIHIIAMKLQGNSLEFTFTLGGITMAANVESMFYVREKPWHGLGTRIEEAPTSADTLIYAGPDAPSIHHSRGRDRTLSGGDELP